MAAAGYGMEDQNLFNTVKAVGMELCPALDIAIPVGKDSLSMRTRWDENGEVGKIGRQVTAPLSLVVTAFAPCADIRRTLTPQLQRDSEVGETELLLVDLGQGRNRLGGSALAQVHGRTGNEAPDTSADMLKAFFPVVQKLNREGCLLAYHDRSDGGLFATVCEMSFASHIGVSLNLDALCYDPLMNDVDGYERSPQIVDGRMQDRMLAALFNEELGAVMQIRRADREIVMQVLREAGLGKDSHLIGSTNTHDEVRIWRNAKQAFVGRRSELQQAWSEVSYQIARLRDDPACVKEEFDALADASDPGLSVKLTFTAAPFVSTGARPRVAVLREQGVNGQVEMAAAFHRAGFDSVDVHMSDLQNGRARLADFAGFVACGGFSYGDVLGAGQGWAKSILFNAQLRDQFSAFFARNDSFALGVCNGCQMMSNLASIISGAAHWPTFHRNRSEQFEARFVMVEVTDSPSIFFRGMAGSKLPVVVSHGEGRAVFAEGAQAQSLAALRYVDNSGAKAITYPFNPNGSPDGITAVTTPDGRFTVMMPHPERVFRSAQMSWHPADMGGDSPWLQLFHNARRFVG
jgi:phosphoribosylformylglycinamidine synthase